MGLQLGSCFFISCRKSCILSLSIVVIKLIVLYWTQEGLSIRSSIEKVRICRNENESVKEKYSERNFIKSLNIFPQCWLQIDGEPARSTSQVYQKLWNVFQDRWFGHIELFQFTSFFEHKKASLCIPNQQPQWANQQTVQII